MSNNAFTILVPPFNLDCVFAGLTIHMLYPLNSLIKDWDLMGGGNISIKTHAGLDRIMAEQLLKSINLVPP